MYRNFVFTINNPTADAMDKLKPESKYLVYGEEIAPTTGTPHLQGYCELKKRTRFAKLKSLIPTAHIEKRKGTAKEAADYCKKEGKYQEYGSMSRPGTRNDIMKLYEAVKKGTDEEDMFDAYPKEMYRYYRAVERHRNSIGKKPYVFMKVETYVFYGESGSGKTRRVYAECPNVYRVMHAEETLWWDGYHGQEAILFDEFYGGVKYSKMLELLDGYYMQLPIKGGHTVKRWKKVYITSNQPPERWYSSGLTPALARRLTYIERLGVSITPQPPEHPLESLEKPLERSGTEPLEQKNCVSHE